jgi:biopolymer transport protein ExbB
MWAFLTSGGAMMVPLVALAVLVTDGIFERLFYYRSIERRDAALKAALPDLLAHRDYTAAKDRCDESATPLGRVVKRAIESRAMSEGGIKEVTGLELAAVLPLLERHVAALGTASQVATLVGLLGTVLGNIRAFGLRGSGGAMGNPALLAAAISQALFTTDGGLVVAIPALVFHSYFTSRVNRLFQDMESFTSSLILTITRGL